MHALHRAYDALTFFYTEPRIFLYYLKYSILNSYPSEIVVQKFSHDALIQEIRRGKSLIRIGDGEGMLITGRSIHYQVYDPHIRLQLKTMLKNYSPNSPYILAVPHFGLEESEASLKSRGRERIWKLLRILFKYFPQHTPYADAVDFYRNGTFKQIIMALPSSTNFVILSNAENNTTSLKDYFSRLNRSFIYITTASKNAYHEIEKLREKIIELQKSGTILVITAMGPAGKILAYELSVAKNIQSIDLGHGIEILSSPTDYSNRL